MIIPFTQHAIAHEDAAHSHESNKMGAALTITTGDEFILEVSSDIGDVDALIQMATKLLRNEGEAEISPMVLYCCEPNQPTRDVRVNYHVRIGNGRCETYYQEAKYCETCGSIYPRGPKRNVKTLTTTSSCP